MRFLHTMIRVMDLEISIFFYEKNLGLELKRRKDYPSGSFTLAFLGLPGEEDGSQIELTYNWDRKEPYETGDGFGHLAFEVDDIYQCCKEIKKKGGKITRAPGPMKHGKTVIAFIEDPDGYKIELIQKGSRG